MSRIEAVFAENHKRGRRALVPYITAGDPHPDVLVELMHAMVKAGADLIELGVPFSDPMADGPTIQAANERALRYDVSLRDVLRLVRQFRDDDDRTPVVLMGYLNPIEAIGYDVFATEAQEAGVDGVLTVDLPPEEGAELRAELKRAGIDPIFLIAPTTAGQRLQRICAAAAGFVYYVSLKGVTGAAHLDVRAVAEKVAEIRAAGSPPVGVGFGISDAASAAAVAEVADAVVVGSALVRRIEQHQDDREAMLKAVSEVLSEMRTAMDAATTAT